jgi:hypothetical protein
MRQQCEMHRIPSIMYAGQEIRRTAALGEKMKFMSGQDLYATTCGKVKNAVKFSNLARPAVDQLPLTASSQAHTSHTKNVLHRQGSAPVLAADLLKPGLQFPSDG